MKTLKFGSGTLIFAVALWWLLFALLSLSRFNGFELLNIVGFPALVVLPGALTAVALRMYPRSAWVAFGLSVALSLLEIMLVGLVGNFLWPILDVSRPLDSPALLEGLSLLILVLSICAYTRLDDEISLAPLSSFMSRREALIAFFPAVFCVLAVFGAIHLNDGGSGAITYAMLIGLSLFFAYLLYRSDRFGDEAIAVALYFAGLALLLMTSLRGWYITGHDIQREFEVFQLAKQNGIWSMAAFRDAYNACLSITILPTILSNMLSLSDPYVFKLLFQMIFAIAPGFVYLIARRYLSRALSIGATIYFVAFPTYFTDMPFLDRQEIAFVFLAMMLYLIFDDLMPLTLRRTLFVLLGIGMVISHYSTTYVTLALLLFMVLALPAMRFLAKRMRSRLFAGSGIESLRPDAPPERRTVTFGMVAIMLAATFIWTEFTNVSANSLTVVIGETIAAMANNVTQDTRSADISYSLFSSHPVDDQALLALYGRTIVDPARASAPSDMYLSTSTLARYPVSVAPPELLPLTALGSALQSAGIDASRFNDFLRQSSAKLVQLLIIVGGAAAVFSRRYLSRPLGDEFVALSLGSVIILVAFTVLPVLSVQYGVLRALQQSLMLLGVFIVIGSATLFALFPRRFGILLACTLAVFFLISSTGVITQSLGLYDPQLHLNNAGTYYDLYYVTESEEAGKAWLSDTLANAGTLDFQSEIEGPRFEPQVGGTVLEPNSLNDIYPGLIRADSYVFLGAANTERSESALTVDGTLVRYTYPIALLDDAKDLIYNNGDVRIYH